MAYDVKPKEEGGWVGWQTAFAAVIAGTLLEYTGMSGVLAAGIGTFAAATSRPVIGYLIGFRPKPKP